MKYHRHQGVVEKDRKGHKKLWLGFVASFAIVAYGGFLFINTMLNGWPIEAYDTTAKIVKTTKPGAQGDGLYIPAINTRSAIGKGIIQKGDIGNEVTLSGAKFALGFTPDGIRHASPFFNLEQLKVGDQVFVDRDGTRHAYEIVDSTDNENKLTLTNGQTQREAKALGTITWQDGKPTLESL